jgi:hypothetical protein
MDLKKLIKEVLYGDCCKAIKPTRAPILNENLAPRLKQDHYILVVF